MKRLFKIIKKIVTNFWVRLVVLLAGVGAILALGFAPLKEDTIWYKLNNLLSNSSALSAVLVAGLTLIAAGVLIKIKPFTEESLKVESDHHKIVCKYNKHSKEKIGKDKNYFNKDGVRMSLFNVAEAKNPPKNPVKDVYSDEYKFRQDDINDYTYGNPKNGEPRRLFLPSISVCANVLGNTRIVFKDSAEKFKLPSFLNENALDLLEAHKTSNFSNNSTIRLDDLTFNNNVLVLKTRRSQYYDMLISNRCMDYKLKQGVSVRDVYESGSTVSSLENSRLGNQIGINGLIFTKDGYILTEKRGRKKTIWKNKFAQPISLALKTKDLNLGEDGKIGADFNAAEENLKKVILKTIKNNFALQEEDIASFTVSNNFLGVARDLLEGGKPNMYFYVIVNKDKDEFAQMLQGKTARAAVVGNHKLNKNGDGETEVLPLINKDKLDSQFYLIPYGEVFIDYDYALKIKARSVIRIKRKYYPRVNKLMQNLDGFSYRFKRAVNGSIKRECGEALLACMYYANICGDRIERERKSLSQNGKTEENDAG